MSLSSSSSPSSGSSSSDEDEDEDVDDPIAAAKRVEREMAERKRKELDRLHKLGIMVPGVEISVDKMRAVVWLEDLEVESSIKIFADRVRAVVERAVEVTAPLWGA